MSTNVLPAAEASPRLANGCICWYEGDTFELELQLEVTDQDGETVEITGDDRIRVTFWDEQRQFVQEFLFTDIAENTVTLAFTDEVSARFPKGTYRYDLRLETKRKTTIMRNNTACVE